MHINKLPDIPVNLKQPWARERATRVALILYQKFGEEWFELTQLDTDMYQRLGASHNFPRYREQGIVEPQPNIDRARYRYRLRPEVVAALKEAGF